MTHAEVTPGHAPRRFAVSTVGAAAVAVLLSVAACVDLTKPWQLHRSDGAAGADGAGAPATGGQPSSSGGATVDGAADGAAGAGGSRLDAAVDSPFGGTGGAQATDVGAPAGGAGMGGGIDVGTGTAGAGGAAGSLDGPLMGGTGGGDAPLGGAGGTPQPDGGTDAPGDPPRAGEPDAAPDTPPDLASDKVDAVSLPPDVVAYYPCESATGTVLPDRSGNGNDATLTVGLPADGGPPPSGVGWAFAAGKIGNALTLVRGGYGYVSMPPAIFNGATAATIVAWVKVGTAQNWQRVFDTGVNAHLDANQPTGTQYFNFVPQNGSAQLEAAISANGYTNQQVLNRPSITPASGWRHVAVTIDGSRGIVYLDSLAVATSTNVTLRPVDLGTIDYAYLGKSQWGADPYFDGQLDEVRIYRRALSATEVQTLWQLTSP